MSAAPSARPTLLPTLRRLWRAPGQLQLGTDPRRAVLLELPDPAYAQVLDLLDGSRTRARVLREAARSGVPEADTAALLATLDRAGLTLDARALQAAGVPAPARHRFAAELAALALHPELGTPAAVLARRRAARVLVTGASQLGVPIACALGAAGVGRPWPVVDGVTRPADAALAGLLPRDAQRSRTAAALDALHRAAPDADLTPLRPAQASFVVLVGLAAPPVLTAASLEVRGLPHLAVSLRDGAVVVGPLVRPGQTPCLNCLDLHRQDRDPAWPTLSAQLHTGPPVAEAVAAATALAAVAYAAAEVLRHIDGEVPLTEAMTVELDGPGRELRRRWSQHPRCRCLRRPRARRRAPGGDAIGVAAGAQPAN